MTSSLLRWVKKNANQPTLICLGLDASCRGTVTRYELPNLYAVNFVLTQILDGGAMRSLRLDPQGKTLGDSLLLMPLEAGASDVIGIENHNQTATQETR